jgi:DNA-binding GntR family transcriptional regulator
MSSDIPLGRSPLQLGTLGHVVASHIARQIVQGTLAAGTSLPPASQLGAELGVSASAIREAMRILQAEGLVRPVPGSHRGARVVRPSAETVVRYARLTMRRRNATVGDVVEAVALVESATVIAGADALRRERFDEQPDLSTAFHRKVVELAGNTSLQVLHDVAIGILTPYLQQDALCAAGAEHAQLAINVGGMGPGGATAWWRRHVERALLRRITVAAESPVEFDGFLRT